jgi:hypothetical protein
MLDEDAVDVLLVLDVSLDVLLLDVATELAPDPLPELLVPVSAFAASWLGPASFCELAL